MEQLEARIVLSLTYYETIGIDDFVGFPGGDLGSLAGASEDGRFLWSNGTTADARDEEDPAFLVVEQEYRPIDLFPSLIDADIADINSSGMVLGIDRATERAFLTEIIGIDTRVYLDEIMTSAPPEFDVRAVVPVELGDGGIVVMIETAGNESTRVWGLLDGSVRLLWTSQRYVLHIDATPDNTVTGSRYTVYDPIHWENSRTEGVRWSPDGEVEALSELMYAIGVNSRGEILGMISAPDRDVGRQTVLWRDGVITPVEDFYMDWSVGLDDDLNVLLSRHESMSGGAWDFPSVSRDGVNVELSELGGIGGLPVSITDSGLLVFKYTIVMPVSPEVIVGAGHEDVLVTTETSGRVIAVFKNQRGGMATISLLDGEVQYGEMGRGISGTGFARIGDAYTSARDGMARVVLGGTPYVFNTDQQRLERDTVLGSVPIVATTAFQSATGLERIVLIDEDGQLSMLFQKPGIDWQGNPAFIWNKTDLSDLHLARRGLSTPAYTSNLDSFVTPWGAMNIVGLDEAGDLHAVWWSPGLGSPLWTTTNLSELTGAPKLVGNIVGSATAWSGMQIMGTDTRGNLISIWWSPTSGGWKWTDLTAEAGGVALEAGSIAGATTPWGAIEVVGRTAENELVTYWWAPGTGGWVFESITAQQVGDVPRIAGPISLVVASDGSQHIAGVSAEGEVIHLYWLPDGSDLWRAENLTALAIG